MPFAFVLFEGVRSAEPPSSSGMAAARWSSTAPLAARVAISLPLGDELGAGRRDGLASSRRATRRCCDARTPGAAPSGAALTRSAQAMRAARPLAPIVAPGVQQVLGDDERRRIPAEDLARAGDFLLARRVAMGLLGAGPGREAEADDGLAGDHRRLVGHRAGGGDGVADRVRVVAVDLLHMPAGGAEALDV